MILVYVPCICSAMFLMSISARDMPFRYPMIFILHVVLALALAALGAWLGWKDALPTMAHFLEDSQRSNELLVFYTWVPFAWFAVPTLVVGTAQDIADTGPQILGFLLYLPLLDEARKLTMMWMAYCLLASARSLQLCMSHAGMKFQLTPFLLRILLLELAGLVAGRARIWYLSRQGTPLTSSYLDQCSRSKEVQPVDTADLQQEHQVIPYSYVPSGACGRAEMIARSVWHRRRLYKDELKGRLLWAVHLHAEKQLTSDVLLHILTFLHEPERPVTTFLGLLSDDNTSQISGSQRTRSQTLSSLSSVSLLRRSIPLKLRRIFELKGSSGGRREEEDEELEVESSNLQALPLVALSFGVMLGTASVSLNASGH
ncbi:unnamed protein product [Symbiodinium sp. CCMP2456]|nr:unnamed protein product [Symbiodinium sp. CCMP2456]